MDAEELVEVRELEDLEDLRADAAHLEPALAPRDLAVQLAEETVDRFDTYRIEAVTFTSATKNDMATRMLWGFEDRRIRIPVSRVLRDDLHSVKKVNLPGGGIRYDAERTKEGHADRFWAGGLAMRASDEPAKPQVFISAA